jgi:hypothetical protein
MTYWGFGPRAYIDTMRTHAILKPSQCCNILLVTLNVQPGLKARHLTGLRQLPVLGLRQLTRVCKLGKN